MKPVLRVLSPGGRRARLTILIFHRVLAEPDPLFPDEPDASRFDTLCGWMKNWFNVLPLDEAVDRLNAKSLPPRAAAITFDDGYADNCVLAAPILKKHGLTATFFVATGFLNGGRMWNDTVVEAIRLTKEEWLDLRALKIDGLVGVDTSSIEARREAIRCVLPRLKYLPQPQRDGSVMGLADLAGVHPSGSWMMRDSQVRQLRSMGMIVGAHTVTHPILARLDQQAAQREMQESRDALQSLIGEPVQLFAYPNGKPNDDYGVRDRALAERLGFKAAVNTAWGTADLTTDRFQLPRFTPWDRSNWKFGLRLAANLVRTPAA